MNIIQGQVLLKQGRDASVRRFHPWVFSGAIQSVKGEPADGDWVSVADAGGKVLGYGHYQRGTITVRILVFQTQLPGASLYRDRISDALQLRSSARVMSPETNCYRLIHGEGDGLPGLIIDYYNGVLVLQPHTAGMFNDRVAIAGALREVYGESAKAIYLKGMATGEGKASSEYLHGLAGLPHTVSEYGNLFQVDWESGQKTGFFLDQRENRKMLGTMAKGRRVLNTFCYTGGFSVYALQGGAESVDSIDASEKAIELARRNLSLNGYDADRNTCLVGDTFDFLKDKNDHYDLIVLDPPAFAKHKAARHQAMKGYQRLNAEAMRVIRPGGLLFTFSCSQVVDRQLFYDTVVSAAIQAGRDVKVLSRLSQPSDHPVSMFHPEGEYLKGLLLYVR